MVQNTGVRTRASTFLLWTLRTPIKPSIDLGAYLQRTISINGAVGAVTAIRMFLVTMTVRYQRAHYTDTEIVSQYRHTTSIGGVVGLIGRRMQ